MGGIVQMFIGNDDEFAIDGQFFSGVFKKLKTYRDVVFMFKMERWICDN